MKIATPEEIRKLESLSSGKNQLLDYKSISIMPPKENLKSD
jgi:hypothetical protein